MHTQQLTCPLEIKSVSDEGRFAGYASVFDVVDNQRDVVLRGAFAKSLREQQGRIKLLWQHQMDEPIGMLERAFEDNRGLYVEGRLLLHVARAREAYALLKAGAMKGLSIGYKPTAYDFDPQSGVRRLQQVELFEVSLVTFPANEAAGVTVVKQDASFDMTQLVALSEALSRGKEVLGIRD